MEDFINEFNRRVGNEVLINNGMPKEEVKNIAQEKSRILLAKFKNDAGF